MSRFRSVLRLFVAVVGVVIFGSPSPAQAAFQVKVTTSSGTQTFDGTDDILVKSGDLSVLDPSSTFNIHATTSVVGGVTFLDLQVADWGFFLNTTDLVVQASLTGVTTTNAPVITIIPAGTGVEDYLLGGFFPSTARTWISADPNTLYSENNLLYDSAAPTATNPQHFSPSSPYTLTTEFRLENITAGSLLGFGLDTNISITPTPAPAGLVLVLTGLPILGFGSRLLRRRTSLTT